MNRVLFKKIKKILVFLHIYKICFGVYLFFKKISIILKNYSNKLTKKTVPILLYHRIDNVLNDPHKLVVPPKNFEDHIKFIKSNFSVISLNELIYRLNTNSIKGDEICITFDDGYRDNFTNALPILEKYESPATIFITTSQIGKKASFDWDKAYNESDKAYFLSEEEIKILSKNPFIEIGAHTHNHKRLSDLCFEEQFLEIETSKNILENIIKKPINHFAYPFGNTLDFNNTTKDIIKKIGFISAYENTGLLGTKKSDIYSFPRINMRTCTTKKLAKQIYKTKI